MRKSRRKKRKNPNTKKQNPAPPTLGPILDRIATPMAETSSSLTRFRSLFYNTISLVGLGLACICLLVGLPLLLMDIFASHTNPYAGIFLYGLLPGASFLGLGVAMAGAFLERRRRKQSPGTPIPLLPRIDLNDSRQRMTLVGAMSAI